MGSKHIDWLILAATLTGLFQSACGSGNNSSSKSFLDASVMVLELPKEMGSEQRTAVEFNHGLHTRAMQDQGCGICHTVDENQVVSTDLNWAEPPKDGQSWMRAYHAFCISCHQEKINAAPSKPKPPTDCGLCHKPRVALVSDKVPMRMSASLHARHIQAASDKCETCHHIYDEEKQELVVKPGSESNCWHCHTARSSKKMPSRRQAAHLMCINCHIKTANQGKKTGPWKCEGCHDQDELTKIRSLDQVPRLKRGQPDLLWIDDSSSDVKSVAFDHKAHETLTSVCSDCHHQTLQACGACHKTGGDGSSGGIALEQAYHMSRSRASCIGCHAEQLDKRECAGCHGVLGKGPGEASCRICHAGPNDASSKTKASLNAALGELDWQGLPNASKDFPDRISIGLLEDQYQPVNFPHKRIALSLDKIVRDSRLARRFHGKSTTLCVACHHHTPPGERFLSCKACHGEKTRLEKDLPNLTQAYHRQCIGCHQRMDHPAQGCEDCHKKSLQEVQP